MEKKPSKFEKETLKRLEKDQSAEIASRNFRKAMSGVKSQITALEGKISDDEIAIEDAEVALESWKYPTTAISDAKSYSNGLAVRKSELENLKKELEKTKASLEFFKSVKAEFEQTAD